MKTIVALSCLLSISIAAMLPDSQWERYKAEYKKTYNGELDGLRLKIYKENINEIVAHNRKFEAGLVSYTKGVNQFTDMLRSEVELSYMGLNYSPPLSETCSPHNSSGKTPPSSIDWRKKQAVTQVKEQGHCASSWAFSAVTALEGQLARKTKTAVSLSEQEILDCDQYSGAEGCDGGSPWQAYNYIKKAGGIVSEESYPYTAGHTGYAGQCKSKGRKVVTSVSSCQFIEEGDEAALENAVGNVGPISVSIAASGDFVSYQSGILCGDGCDISKESQSVAVVGYGTDEKLGDYWLIKNSWGKLWGESGYIRVCRNKGNEACVASFGTYPVL